MSIIPKSFIKIFVLLLVAVQSFGSYAKVESVAPDEYLNRIFEGQVPESQTIWMSGEVKDSAIKILGHEPNFLRLRYWRDNTKTVWIIDEIGKTEPITFGFVVASNKIESAEVLEFRESRGWEIQYEFFRKQFTGAFLDTEQRLDRTIDGISGATLSVRAMTRVSRLVLYLSENLAS